MTVLAQVLRNGFVESVHHGRLLVLDAGGRDVLRIGDVEAAILPRSSNKPLQAIAMRRLGVDASTQELALGAASHNGEPAHVAVVVDRLSASGLSVADLQCPADWPLYEPARVALIRSGGEKAPQYMNCSGKHALMLAACVARDWPTDTYLELDHPLQQAIGTTIAELAGETIPATATDGCGAPIFALSLRGLARAFRTAAEAEDGAEYDVATAMRQHPFLIAGTDRPLTRLVDGVPGLIGKDGAEGVWAVAVPGVGAVAVKIDDGANRACVPVVVAALRHLGIDAPVLGDLATEPVLGGGAPVGEIRANPDALALGPAQA